MPTGSMARARFSRVLLSSLQIPPMQEPPGSRAEIQEGGGRGGKYALATLPLAFQLFACTMQSPKRIPLRQGVGTGQLRHNKFIVLCPKIIDLRFL